MRQLYTLVFLLLAVALRADNSSRIQAFPLTGITVDGHLGDWPQSITAYPIAHYHFGREAEGPDDLLASWRVGYDSGSRTLYVGISVTDDDYVAASDAPNYDNHDFQVLYLDFEHSSAPDGVIAFEVSEQRKQIVEQEKLGFYPQVAAASWDMVEVAILREGNTVHYEWSVVVPGTLGAGRVIGIDYVVFDKDRERPYTEVSWGPKPMKFRNDRALGDLIFMETGMELYPAVGRLSWVGEPGTEFPPFVTFNAEGDPGKTVTTPVDSTGGFRTELTKGEYALTVPASLSERNWNEVDRIVQQGAPPQIGIGPGSNSDAVVNITVAGKPGLIPAEGILSEPFGASAAVLLDSFVEAYRAYYDIPAGSLAILQDSQAVYHQTYGSENTVAGPPLRPEAVFEAASITKSVYAYAINRLVQRGEFDLDRPLSDLLPFEELEEDFPDYRLMTGRHVLTHVSGLPNWGARLEHRPGTTYGYSGEGFEYLKRAVASQTGEEWAESTEQLLAREVLLPLGMTNTYFSCNPSLRRLKVSGHREGLPMPYDCPERPGVAWSMHTEAADFVPFALGLLERKGLTEERAAEMFAFHTVAEEEDWVNGYRSGFGLGIALRDSPHGLVFGHGGNNGDFKCNFEVYDELGNGFIVFTNADYAGPLLSDLAQFLVEGRWE